MNSEDTSTKPLVVIATASELHNKYLRKELEKAGVRVLSCRSGDEALALTTTHHPSIVIVEYELNGVEVALSLRSNKETSSIFILFLLIAGSEYPESASRFERGTVGFLTYPYGLNEVKVHVCRALDYLEQQNGEI